MRVCVERKINFAYIPAFRQRSFLIGRQYTNDWRACSNTLQASPRPLPSHRPVRPKGSPSCVGKTYLVCQRPPSRFSERITETTASSVITRIVQSETRAGCAIQGCFIAPHCRENESGHFSVNIFRVAGAKVFSARASEWSSLRQTLAQCHGRLIRSTVKAGGEKKIPAVWICGEKKLKKQKNKAN